MQGVFRDITPRKKAEAALRESEEKFSKAFNASPDMVIITNIKDGTYVEVNDSFVSGTGYQREELIGHTVDEFALWANPEDSEKMMRMIESQGNIQPQDQSGHGHRYEHSPLGVHRSQISRVPKNLLCRWRPKTLWKVFRVYPANRTPNS